MRSYISWIVLAGLISGCSSAPTSIAVFNSRMIAAGECISGNCKNGYGTFRYPDGSDIAANRVNGDLVAGDAEFRYSCLLEKTFTLTLNNAGRPVSGTIVRCGDLRGSLESGRRTTFFTGTFQTISNPFTQEQITTYQTGTYTDGNGVKWEGEFSYIPVRDIVDTVQWGEVALRKGSFVFMGAKIDAQFDEVVRGLYISEPVSPGSEIAFFKARPDYLAKLRSTFVAEREQDTAVREADARASRELFNNFVNIASASAVVYGTYKLEQAASNRAHMDSLNQVITGQKSPTKANAQLPKGNQGEARIPAQPMTMAEYRNLQKTRQAQENTSIQQQEQERLQKQARLQEQAQAQQQARQQEQERKQEQARKKAEEEKAKLASGSSGSSAGPSAEKIYVCPSREYFTSLMHYRAKNVETFTFEEACARAEQKAAEFVAGVGKYKFGLKDFADKRVVKNVDACLKTKSGDQVVVYVNLEGPELRPCGTASTGVSR